MDDKSNLDDSERNNSNYTISGLLNSLGNQENETAGSENDTVECSSSKFGKNCCSRSKHSQTSKIKL